jgi:hypothetical protein
MKVLSCLLAFIPFFNIISYIYAFGGFGIILALQYFAMCGLNLILLIDGVMWLSFLYNIYLIGSIFHLIYMIIKK